MGVTSSLKYGILPILWSIICPAYGDVVTHYLRENYCGSVIVPSVLELDINPVYIESQSGIFSKYPTNMDCTLTIKSSHLISSYKIKLVFYKFEVASGCGDVFYAYDGSTTSSPRLKSECGYGIDKEVTSVKSTGKHLTIRFLTDSINDDLEGFKVLITRISSLSSFSNPGGTYYMKEHFCGTELFPSNLELDEESALIYSQYGSGLLSKYPASMDCTLTIKTTKYYKIKLTFDTFEVAAGCGDVLYAYDGSGTYWTLLRRQCGYNSYQAIKSISSTGQDLTIRFKSDSVYDDLKGFKLSYERIGESSNTNKCYTCDDCAIFGFLESTNRYVAPTADNCYRCMKIWDTTKRTARRLCATSSAAVSTEVSAYTSESSSLFLYGCRNVTSISNGDQIEICVCHGDYCNHSSIPRIHLYMLVCIMILSYF